MNLDHTFIETKNAYHEQTDKSGVPYIYHPKLAELLRKAESGESSAMFRLGIAHYWGDTGSIDKHKAFELISRAMQIGLKREQSVDDHPGYEYGELAATWYLAKMFLEDDCGILSQKTEPFWLEKKTFESASDVERILMYIIGVGSVGRDLKEAYKIAFWIEDSLSFSHRHNRQAEDLCELLQKYGDIGDK